MHSILRKYDPLMETVGLDEANLDVTEYLDSHIMTTEIGKNYVAE